MDRNALHGDKYDCDPSSIDQARRTVLKTIAYAAPVTIMLLTSEAVAQQSEQPIE